jgi:anthranilate phosphoribosyltransferase
MTGDMTDLKALIGQVAQGRPLSEAEAERAFDIIMSGNATPAQMGAFLMALRVRGETVEEITGAARIMRSKALPIEAPPDAIDTCGTGGDGAGTWNISTAAAIVVAGAGVPVAKHGNRALSSKSGAADVLAALGVNLDCDMALVKRSLWEHKICFLMAPRHHSAMRHVGPTRVELGTRTIFNLIGPCSNPAGVRRQLLGVFSPDWLEPLVEVLAALGSKRVIAVHGSDGLDEITTTGPSKAVSLENGAISSFEIVPEDLGIARAAPADLKGGDGEHNALALRAVLSGERTPYRDIAVLNAAAALMVAGKARTLAEGVTLARASLDQGRAEAALDRLIAISND